MSTILFFFIYLTFYSVWCLWLIEVIKMNKRIVTDPENDVEYQAWLNRTPEEITKFNQSILKELKEYLNIFIEQNVMLDENDSNDLLCLLSEVQNNIFSNMRDMGFELSLDLRISHLDNLIQYLKFERFDNHLSEFKFNFETPENIPQKDIRFVYIAESKGAYKIGSTKDLVQRLKQFTTGNHQIEIIASLKTSFEIANRIEKLLHNVYKQNNIRNEWFNFTPDELAYIIKILRFNHHV